MQKSFNKLLAVVLSVVMLIGILPMVAFANIEGWEENNVIYDGENFGTNGYYTVISKKDYTLVPGAAYESEIVLNNSNGNRRQVMHIVELDPSNPDVSIVPGYNKIDLDTTDVNNQTAAKVTDMAAYYEDVLGYNVVAGMNTDLTYTNNAPRILVYNGRLLGEGLGGNGKTSSYMGVYKDVNGNVSVQVQPIAKFDVDKLNLYNDANTNEWTEGELRLYQAVGVSFGMIVNNGELVIKTEERDSTTAARSMVGVKPDGTFVFVMNDGRGANNSIGFCNYEEGECMLALGCQWAANCDGGGSSSFVTKRVGEDRFTMRSVPCDGAERPTLHALFVVSNVGPTGELNNVNVNADYDYFAPGTTYTFSPEAIDTHGYGMDMPADAAWALSDPSFGTIADGTFVSNGTLGDVDIQVLSGGNVVGTRTIHVANPEILKLETTETVLPYSTPDKPRETTIPVIARVGEADIFYDETTFTVTLDDPTAATMNGFTIHATEDTSKTGIVITLTYVPTSQELTYTVTYGRGSEILWDFEGGIDGWLGQQDAHDWQVAHGVTPFDEDTTSSNSLVKKGQMNFSSRSRTFLSTKENGGQVHNGHSALGVEYDFNGADFNNWVYMILFNVLNVNGSNPDCVLRDVENGKNATGIGMWLYLPVGFYDQKNNGALALQMNIYFRKASGEEGQDGINMQYNGKNLNALTEKDIPDTRWIYVKGALPNYPYIALTNPMQSNHRAPSIFRMYIKPSIAQTLTYYYDDITLDYSNAVDDRNEPQITDPSYALNDTAIALENGATIAGTSATFSANAADFLANNTTGLNTTTAQVYLDGVPCTTAFNHGQIIAEDVKLANGEHTVMFEIYDNIGNIAQVKRTFTCTDETYKALYLDGHNDSGMAPEAGSIYYIDLKAKEIEKVNKAVATIDLQTANTWQLEHMTVTDGFAVTYEQNEAEPEFVTFTITKNGIMNLTGDQTILTIPVRVWSWDESWPFGGDGSAASYGTAARFNSSYGEPVLKVQADIVYGLLNEQLPFSDSFSVDTKLDGTKQNGMWHTHTATALEDQPATCAQDGYTGRTYCEVCQSVVDWGTTLPATGHNYVLKNKVFTCSICGEVLHPGTGLFEMNGHYYCAIADSLVSDWQQIGDDFYYFDPHTMTTVETLTQHGTTFEFEENGKLVSGKWVDDGVGVRYWYGPSYYHSMNGSLITLQEIDGQTYGFNARGYKYTGICRTRFGAGLEYVIYDFGEDGVVVGPYTGIAEIDGNLWYAVDGVPTYAGLIEWDGYYYYITNNCTAARSVTRTISQAKTNGLKPAGTYTFDADGHMVIEGESGGGNEDPNPNPNPDPDPEQPDVKNGLYHENGRIVYYENGVLVRSRLVYADGYYYYIANYGAAIVNATHYVNATAANGLKPAGTYTFDAEGHMVIEGESGGGNEDPNPNPNPNPDPDPEQPDVKNGLYHENGRIVYYENGERVRSRLIYVDDYYYYIANYGAAIVNATHYVNATAANGLKPAGTYTFDAEGHLVEN